MEQLRKIYEHVNDIDLHVGAISEKHTDDAIVGPTFQCIMGKFSQLTAIGFQCIV